MDDFNRDLYTRNNELVNEKLENHEKQITKCTEDISELKQNQSSSSTEVINICESMEKLNTRIEKIIDQNRDMMKFIIVILVGFFFYVIEQKIFK